jgi:tetratricopeptide (TPR) repeat protein
MDIKQQSFDDVPMFQIFSFKMYELNENGLMSLMIGTNGTRYADRYTVKLIDYTDYSKDYVVNMKANSGIYKDDTVYLDGDVVYFREGSYRKALFDFTRSLEINPGSTLALKNRANVYNRLGAKSAVCDDLKQLCNLGDCKAFNKLSNSNICQK